LGNPVGSVDVGATWGSFVGLFFLAAIYLAIGIFASSLTDNQIISFILAVVLSFIFYLGFDFVATSGIPYLFEQIISWISINNHYLSVSRGVIDLRDMIYFLGMTLLFLQLSTLFIRIGKMKLKKTRMNLALFSLGLLLVFFVSTNFLYRIDLTADKRYSLSQVSKQIAADIDSQVSVELFLTGELQPGLRNLQQEIIEKVAVLNAFSPKPIRIRFTNPYSISNVQKRQEFIEEISRKGVVPTNFQQKTNQGISTKLIFPGAIISSGGKDIAVNFLKFNPDFGHETNFNHSAESVEFELVNAIQKLQRTKKSSLAFLEGHGELNKYQVGDISNSLSADFSIQHVNAQQLGKEGNPDILIIADPNEAFPEIDKFYIDQYIMNGGKVMWLIDPVKVSLDSLTRGFQT
jgi:ABC-2 type transport system permease protein